MILSLILNLPCFISFYPDVVVVVVVVFVVAAAAAVVVTVAFFWVSKELMPAHYHAKSGRKQFVVLRHCRNKEPHSSGILRCRMVVVGYENLRLSCLAWCNKHDILHLNQPILCAFSTHAVTVRCHSRLSDDTVSVELAGHMLSLANAKADISPPLKAYLSDVLGVDADQLDVSFADKASGNTIKFWLFIINLTPATQLHPK